MYRAFSITRTKEFSEQERNHGKLIAGQDRDNIRKPLETFIQEDGSIDGGGLARDWFPDIHAQVFISHSHNDSEWAFGLAGWLNQEFGISSFIDSAIWEHYIDMLGMLSRQHAAKLGTPALWKQMQEELSPHIHLMLASALTIMLDKTECVIFVRSSNSIIENNAQTRTSSPWLLHEIQMVKLLRQKERETHRNFVLEEAKASSARTLEPRITYPVDLSKMTTIDDRLMNNWRLTYKLNKLLNPSEPKIGWSNHALDLLYEIGQK